MQRHRKQGRSWSTDVETATCLKTQLRLNYHEAITITEPDEYQRFRIKIMGCRHQNIAEPTLIDIQRAEHDFRISNNITPGVHFRIEKNVWYDDWWAPTIYKLRRWSRPRALLIVHIGGENKWDILTKTCYGAVNIIQCKRCWQFGHFKRECTRDEICKACGGNRAQQNCPDPSDKPICVNCTK